MFAHYRKLRTWDKEKQDEFHDRVKLYENKSCNNDFIQSNFDASEVAKIKKFIEYENLLKQRCDEFGLPYEPPSKTKWDYQRRQRIHCRWSYNKKNNVSVN